MDIRANDTIKLQILSLGWRWGGTGDLGLGLSSSQPSCAPQLPAEAKRVQEQHGAQQKALETCV